MTISFQCTGCDRTLKVPDELAGRKAKCPKCQTALFIPEGPASAISTAPAKKRAAPAPPPDEEPEERTDETEAAEEAPARRGKKGKKSKKVNKSLLLPLLLAGGGVLLFLCAGGGAFAAWWFFWPGNVEDNYFLPDNTQMVGTIHVNQLMHSGAFQQARTAFPQFDQQVSQASTANAGVDPNDVDQITIGSQALPAGAMPAGAATPSVITVIHTTKPIKPADVEASVQKTSPGLTFTETKIGRWTLYEGKLANAPPAAFGPPLSPPAFVMADDKRVVTGPASLLHSILDRNKKPDFSDKLQAAIKATDFNATIAFAATKDAMPKQGLMPMMPPLGRPGNPATAANPFDKVDGWSVTAKVANDVDLNVTAMCQDAPAANDVRDNVKKGLDQLRGFVALGALAGKVPSGLNDLLDINMQVSGSNVTAVKTIQVAPLIKMAQDQQKAAAPPGFPFPNK